MNIQTLKYEIIEWITRTSDSSLLETLKAIKDSNKPAEDWFSSLSAEETESLNRGIQNHKEGQTLSSKEFWSGYEKEV